MHISVRCRHMYIRIDVSNTRYVALTLFREPTYNIIVVLLLFFWRQGGSVGRRAGEHHPHLAFPFFDSSLPRLHSYETLLSFFLLLPAPCALHAHSFLSSYPERGSTKRLVSQQQQSTKQKRHYPFPCSSTAGIPGKGGGQPVLFILNDSPIIYLFRLRRPFVNQIECWNALKLRDCASFEYCTTMVVDVLQNAADKLSKRNLIDK